MAQKNNKNEIPEIPAVISWNNESSSKPKYRGATMIANNMQQQGAISFKGQGFAKNASSVQTDAFSIPADISGGAIDISFSSSGSGIKSSYPSIEPITFGKAKGAVPIVEVQVLPDDENKNVTENAPMYDGFQPHNAHRSSTMNPIKMQQTVETILNSLVETGNIDFYQRGPFVVRSLIFDCH